MRKLFLLFLLTSFFHSGETFQAPIRSDFVLADSAINPYFKLDREGNIHAVWRKFAFSSVEAVYYAVFDSLGQNIRPPARVSPHRLTLGPHLAISEGHVAVVWAIPGNLDSDIIEFNVFDLSKEIVPGAFYIASDDVYFPDVAQLSDTTFLVVWIGESAFTQSDFQIHG